MTTSRKKTTKFSLKRSNSPRISQGCSTLFSVACFSFSTLARVSSRSSMSFLSSEHSSSSFLFLAVSSAFISSSSSSLSVSSLALASSWILLLIRPSQRSSASVRLSCSYGQEIKPVLSFVTFACTCRELSDFSYRLNLEL